MIHPFYLLARMKRPYYVGNDISVTAADEIDFKPEISICSNATLQIFRRRVDRKYKKFMIQLLSTGVCVGSSGCSSGSSGGSLVARSSL